MAVVASEDGELVMQDPLTQENSIVTETEEIDEVEEDDIEMQDLKIEPSTPSKSSTQSSQNDPKLQKEMETCFGFDEVSNTLCFLTKLFFFNIHVRKEIIRVY